jgi:hypothetical protein
MGLLGLLKRNSIIILIGWFVPCCLMLLEADLSPYTWFLWPTWIFLIGLGGQINEFGDYVFIAFTILINGFIYLIVGNILRFVYVKFFSFK